MMRTQIFWPCCQPLLVSNLPPGRRDECSVIPPQLIFASPGFGHPHSIVNCSTGLPVSSSTTLPLILTEGDFDDSVAGRRAKAIWPKHSTKAMEMRYFMG